MPDHITVVEDDVELRELLVDVLTEAGYAVNGYGSAELALHALRGGQPSDLVVTDLVLPGMRGRELVGVLGRERPEVNVIAITAFGSIDSAIELVKAGAYDYLTKPLANDELLLAVERALTESARRRELTVAVAEQGSGGGGEPGIIGASGPMRAVFQLITRAAWSRHPVLITGESGTGKELVARAVHERSGRSPFVAVNCGALPEHLVESELFGHERGAFTSADRSKAGLFESADRGTLFLDEIAELPLALQPKLLRALDAGEVKRLGATTPRHVDARIIAATNRDLEVEVREGRFRSDLYWRLDVIHVALPPLRERPSDIRPLAEHFLRQAAGGAAPERPTPERISRDALALLTSYPWPGNVRELRNAIERATVVAGSGAAELRAEDLPERIRETGGAARMVEGASRRRLSLKDLERLYILEVLRQVGGNKSRAAEILGLDRKTLYRKLDEYGTLDPSLQL